MDRAKIEFVVILSALLAVAAFGWWWLTAIMGPQPVAVISEPEPKPEPIVFNVDGVMCYFDTRPVLTYKPTDQTVSVFITCGVELLDAYLPAVERTQ